MLYKISGSREEDHVLELEKYFYSINSVIEDEIFKQEVGMDLALRNFINIENKSRYYFLTESDKLKGIIGLYRSNFKFYN